MIVYVDKTGVKYPTFWDFKQAHPELVCGEEPTKELLGLLELSELEVPASPGDLEKARAEALEDLNKAFMNFRQNEAKVKSSLGYVVDATERAFVDVSGLVVITEASQEPIVFMDADNNPHELTHKDFLQIRNEIALNNTRLYQMKWRYREIIEHAKNAEEMNAGEWEFGANA